MGPQIPIFIRGSSYSVSVVKNKMITRRGYLQAAGAALREMYGRDISDPEAWRISRWGFDPYSYGAYSYIPVGVTGEAHDWLAEPVNGRLFFAGEATHRTYPSTVHGAFLSGQRAARQIIALAA